MCPTCIASAAWAVAGVTSTSGLTGLVVKKLRAKTGANGTNPTTESKGERDEPAKSRVAR